MRHGVVTIDDLSEAKKSNEYREMEMFSDAFVQTTRALAVPYAGRWVADPFHQWSRMWEYPYVYSMIAGYAAENSGRNLKILDAGSGLTFFPFYLQQKGLGKVDCCDSDPQLPALYNQVNEATGNQVGISRSDLSDTGHENQSFDIVYCISVLEHTGGHEKILDEFKRILKPNGIVVLTLDIGLDGVSDVPASRADALVEEIRKRFRPLNRDDGSILSVVKNSDIYTSHFAGTEFPGSLPWGRGPGLRHFIKILISKGRFVTWPPALAIYGNCFVKG